MKYYSADFETTVYEGQESTEVWLAGICELYTEKPIIVYSISDFYSLLENIDEDIIVYFHNEKFDGSFILDYLLRTLKMKQAYKKFPLNRVKWLSNKDMPKPSFKYSISDKGQWYTITIKTSLGRIIVIRDSVKLFPFKLEDVAKAFKTKHQKLEMKYEGYRYAGCEVKPEELEYFKNDLFVLKEALEYMFDSGHNKLTIGACCLYEFKKLYAKEDYKILFPNIYENYIPEEYESLTAGEYIRKAYRGAWTYLVPEKSNQVLNNGLTLDVNSLYPSVMHSSSGNVYPTGQPCFWKGNYIPKKAIGPNKFYYLRIRTSFRIKKGYLPTIQMKGNFLYDPVEFLTRSAVCINGEYFEYYKNERGEVKPVTVTVTLTQTDYALIQEHYKLYNFEILDGCYFYAESGLFDEYIDKYMKIKMNSTGAERTEAKLFLNNLYGKLASSPNSSFKLAYLDNEQIKFRTIHEENKQPGYIPCGAAVTSYARDFTIRHAQANYHGPDKPGFTYADTDSLHLNDTTVNDLVDIDIHKSKLLHWKAEASWDTAIFVRSKTYIEHIIKEDLEECTPHYSITCAGMSDRSKLLFQLALENRHYDNPLDIGNDWLYPNGEPRHITLEDFKIGLLIPGKLSPKRIKGGIILKNGTFEMRRKK